MSRERESGNNALPIVKSTKKAHKQRKAIEGSGVMIVSLGKIFTSQYLRSFLVTDIQHSAGGVF